MTSRYLSQKDFVLKAKLRKILWAQGYTTRINVLLGYDIDPRGRSRIGRAGLTDLDVLGIRLTPDFRIHTVVGECKTGSERVAETLFRLSGVARFFGSDSAMLVRAGQVPDHAPILARTLGIALVTENDLSDLVESYIPTDGSYSSQLWDAFFSVETVSHVLEKLGRLPNSLRPVTVHRETQYWMNPPHLRLTRTVHALLPLAREQVRDSIAQAVFADYVWLYVLALWKACERLAISGVARLEAGLKIYLNGDESGLQSMLRLKNFVEKVTSNEIDLPLFPPYFAALLEVITRLMRRPHVLPKIARRAEWLLFGQLAEQIGPPPWDYTAEDVLCDKLLGDVAIFLGQSSGIHPDLVHIYLDLLQMRGHEVASTTESATLQETQEAHNLANASHRKQESQGTETDIVEALRDPSVDSPTAIEPATDKTTNS